VLKQVHGARVVTVDEPGACFGEEADGAVTQVRGATLAILTADCGPVLLSSDDGVIGAAHAGWRGLHEGVLEATVAAMRELGASGPISAAVGPSIGPECYEFSPADLDAVAARLGDHVRAHTADGRPALDVPAAVRAELERLDVDLAHDEGSCTACDGDRWYSHRARRDVERQAALIWLP
jgi:polyphenol oxidase